MPLTSAEIYRLINSETLRLWARKDYAERVGFYKAKNATSWAKLGEKHRQMRRTKYATDPEYRARILEANRRSRLRNKVNDVPQAKNG